MACAEAHHTLQDSQPTDNCKQKRKSYTRETKLKVIEFYYSRRKNLYQTCKQFELNTKTVLRWIKDEKKIRDSKKGSKHTKHDRRAKYPDVEERLYREYRDLRRKGLKVKGWWFRTKAKQIFEELYPDETFQFSNSWFTGSRHVAISAYGVAPTHVRGSLLTRKQQFRAFIELFEAKPRVGTWLVR